MWANFDTSDFPKVNVIMGVGELNETSWEKFKKDWLDLYKYEKEFEVDFDTSNVGFVNPKYAFRTSSFINELKATEKINGKQLMKKSTIFCNSFYVRSLLNLIFKLKKPVCKIHVTSIKLNVTLSEKEYLLE